MTREKRKIAAEEFKEWRDSYYDKNKLPATMFIEEVIKILEQEPCEDAISRQAVLKIIDGWYEQNRDTENIEDLIVLITYMDSVNPQNPLTEEDYIELRDRFGEYVVFVVKDMVSGKGERWKKRSDYE